MSTCADIAKGAFEEDISMQYDVMFTNYPKKAKHVKVIAKTEQEAIELGYAQLKRKLIWKDFPNWAVVNAVPERCECGYFKHHAGECAID